MILNCNILKTRRCRKFKFGENAFKADPKVLINSAKFDLNALLNLVRMHFRRFPTFREAVLR